MFGVYMGTTASGECGYVGMSSNVERRIHQHKQSPFSVVIVDWVTLSEHETRIQARAAEYAAIERLKPVYNRVNNSTRDECDPGAVSRLVRSASIAKFGSIRAASLAYGIPWATFDRRLRDSGTWTVGELKRIRERAGISTGRLQQAYVEWSDEMEAA